MAGRAPGPSRKALQMDLELEGNEVPVGPFSADVVLRDANTGHLVVVENLLETTDHDHLGKLIAYAAGLEAHWAVLVAKAFRPNTDRRSTGSIHCRVSGAASSGSRFTRSASAVHLLFIRQRIESGLRRHLSHFVRRST